MTTDDTMLEVVLRIRPSTLTVLTLLVREALATARSLADDALRDGDPEAAAGFAEERRAWQVLEAPLVDAFRSLRDRRAVSGEIDTKGGK